MKTCNFFWGLRYHIFIIITIICLKVWNKEGEDLMESEAEMEKSLKEKVAHYVLLAIKYYRIILNYIVMVLLFIMTGSVFTNVITRTFYDTHLNWVDEISRTAFVWMSFIGLTLMMWDRGHVKLGNVFEKVPYLGIGSDILGGILVIIFAVFLWIGGTALFEIGWTQSTPYLGIRMGYMYIVVPFAAANMLLIGVRDLLEVLLK